MRGTLAAALALLAALLLAGPAAAVNPDSVQQPPLDGCGRNPAAYLLGVEQQWAYVGGDPQPRRVRGTVVDAWPTETDLFRVHESYDVNVFLAPDAADHDVLATANLAPGAQQGTIEVEWEERVWWPFAWPGPGDRLDVMGSWVWDCGHWGQELDDPGYLVPGSLPLEDGFTGEFTEIHPPRMVVVHRAAPSTSPAGWALADVVIASQATDAWRSAEQGRGTCLLQDLCPDWIAVNDRDYAFEVPAPPRPSPEAQLRWSVEDRGSSNAPGPLVTALADRIQVVVPFDGWGQDGEQAMFAKTFAVGWDQPRPVTHLRVVLERLDWHAELDGPGLGSGPCPPALPCAGQPQVSLPPDEVVLYVEAAGQWRRIDHAALRALEPGDSIPLDERFDLWLAEGAAWRVYGRARECDMPAIQECPVPTELGFNDLGGAFDHRYAGAASAVGSHEGEGTSPGCLRSAGGPCFTLAYRIEDPELEANAGGVHVLRGAPGPELAGLLVAGLAALALRRRGA